MVEKDFKCFSEQQRVQFKQEIAKKTGNQDYLNVDYEVVGYPKPRGQLSGSLEASEDFTSKEGYASCVRIVDPYEMETVMLWEFQHSGEAVFSSYISSTVGIPG